jgi:quinol-cytochrome oxidoreductase complex cytochrome b subunit
LRHHRSIKTGTDRVPREELLVQEGICMIVVLAFFGALAVWQVAPLAPSADPFQTPRTIKAPWIFLWIQVMLRHLSPLISGILIPFAAFALLAILPWLPRALRPQGYWVPKGHGLIFVLFSLLLGGIAILTLWGLLL